MNARRLVCLAILLSLLLLGAAACQNAASPDAPAPTPETTDRPGMAASSSETDFPQGFVGYWHASPTTDADYNERYAFFEDGTFLYGSNETSGGGYIWYADGNWSFEDGRLVFSIDNRADFDESLEGPVQLAPLDQREAYRLEARLLDDDAVTAEGEARRKIQIDSVDYWEVKDGSSLFDVYYELRNSPMHGPDLATDDLIGWQSASAFVGSRERTDVPHTMNAGLDIFNPDQDTFQFQFEAAWYANSGYLDGTAQLLSEQDAEYIIEATGFNEGGTLSFHLQDDGGIEVAYEGDPASLGLGMNVTVDGRYVAGVPNYPGSVTLDDYMDEGTQQRVLELLGEGAFAELRFVVQDGRSYPNEKLGYSGFIPGLGLGADFLVNETGRIYCLGYNLDGDGYVLYTTDPDYQKKLPPFFELNADDAALRFVYKDL